MAARKSSRSTERMWNDAHILYPGTMQTNEQNQQAAAADARLPEVYALIWKSTEPDGVFDQAEFTSRIPRLMEWLRELYAKGHLVACGGGGFENHSGGLTLVRASGPEEAIELGAGSPMNEIGTTELLVWDVYYADLQELGRAQNLAGTA